MEAHTGLAAVLWLALLIALPPRFFSESLEAEPACLSERDTHLMTGSGTDLVISVAQYQPTEADIFAALPYGLVTNAQTGGMAYVHLNLTISVYFAESLNMAETSISDQINWSNSSGWEGNNTSYQSLYPGVTTGYASFWKKVGADYTNSSDRLLNMKFTNAVSHICVTEAEMSIDGEINTNLFVRNTFICDFDIIATGVFTNDNDAVSVYGRSSGHDPIVSFQIQLRCGEPTSPSLVLNENLTFPVGLATTSGMEVISSEQTGIIAAVAPSAISTIHSWAGDAPLVTADSFRDLNNESCADPLQISRMEFISSTGRKLKAGVLPVSTHNDFTDPQLHSSPVGSILLMNTEGPVCFPMNDSGKTLISIRIQLQVDAEISAPFSSLVIDFSEAISPAGVGVNKVFLMQNEACEGNAICIPSYSQNENGQYLHIDLEQNATYFSVFQSEESAPLTPLCSNSVSDQFPSVHPPLHIPPTMCTPYDTKNSSMRWDMVFAFNSAAWKPYGELDLTRAKAFLRGVMRDHYQLNTSKMSSYITANNDSHPSGTPLHLIERVAILFAALLFVCCVIAAGIYSLRKYRRYYGLSSEHPNNLTERSQLTRYNSKAAHDNVEIDLKVLTECTTVDAEFSTAENVHDGRL